LTAARGSALSVVSEAITPETPQRQMTTTTSTPIARFTSECLSKHFAEVTFFSDQKIGIELIALNGDTISNTIVQQDKETFDFALAAYCAHPSFTAVNVEVAS
jgi:hypothetical protein